MTRMTHTRGSHSDDFSDTEPCHCDELRRKFSDEDLVLKLREWKGPLVEIDGEFFGLCNAAADTIQALGALCDEWRHSSFNEAARANTAESRLASAMNKVDELMAAYKPGVK